MADERECIVCADGHPLDKGIACKNNHFTCNECFAASMPEACKQDGLFEADLHNNAAASPPGCLPCMLFPTGACDDGSLADASIFHSLLSDSEALKTFIASQKRVAANVAIAEMQAAAAKEAKAGKNVLTLAHKLVTDAMTECIFVRCPSCNGGGGQKDEAWCVQGCVGV